MGAYNCCCAQPRKPEDLGKIPPIKQRPDETPCKPRGFESSADEQEDHREQDEEVPFSVDDALDLHQTILVQKGKVQIELGVQQLKELFSIRQRRQLDQQSDQRENTQESTVVHQERLTRESLVNTSQFSFLSGGWKQPFFFPEEQFMLEFTREAFMEAVHDGSLGEIISTISEQSVDIAQQMGIVSPCPSPSSNAGQSPPKDCFLFTPTQIIPSPFDPETTLLVTFSKRLGHDGVLDKSQFEDPSVTLRDRTLVHYKQFSFLKYNFEGKFEHTIQEPLAEAFSQASSKGKVAASFAIGKTVHFLIEEQEQFDPIAAEYQCMTCDDRPHLQNASEQDGGVLTSEYYPHFQKMTNELLNYEAAIHSRFLAHVVCIPALPSQHFFILGNQGHEDIQASAPSSYHLTVQLKQHISEQFAEISRELYGKTQQGHFPLRHIRKDEAILQSKFEAKLHRLQEIEDSDQHTLLPHSQQQEKEAILGWMASTYIPHKENEFQSALERHRLTKNLNSFVALSAKTYLHRTSTVPHFLLTPEDIAGSVLVLLN